MICCFIYLPQCCTRRPRWSYWNKCSSNGLFLIWSQCGIRFLPSRLLKTSDGDVDSSWTEIHCFVLIGRPRSWLWSQRIIATVSLKSLCYSKANNWLFMSDLKLSPPLIFISSRRLSLYSLTSAPVTTGLTGRQQWAEGSIDARALSHKCVCAGLHVCVCVF